MAIGQHHVVGAATSGGVLALGRSEYGRLGLGEGAGDAKKAAEVQGVEGCLEVACGTAVSYAVTREGKLYSWGMGTNGQLATGEEDDVWAPFLVQSKQIKDRSAGFWLTLDLFCFWILICSLQESNRGVVRRATHGDDRAGQGGGDGVLGLDSN